MESILLSVSCIYPYMESALLMFVQSLMHMLDVANYNKHAGARKVKHTVVTVDIYSSIGGVWRVERATLLVQYILNQSCNM